MLEHRNRGRARLLIGVSLMGMCFATAAQAQVGAVRGAAGLHAPSITPVVPARPASASVLTAAQNRSLEAAQANQAKAAAQISLAQQAQAAARIAIGAVPNGLVAGGLVPVAKPVSAASDTTGLSIWQGATAPVQTSANGKANVVVTQTDKRAILSWESFNVGADTTLTFSQKDNGVAKADWVALNRVVGPLDPSTGLRDPGARLTPTQILGTIKADGTVLILDRAGVMFGATAQINTHSLLVSSMEIGRTTALSGSVSRALTLRERNDEFLNYGLLGFRDQASQIERTSAFTVSPMAGTSGGEGGIVISRGAQLSSGDSGFLMALAPTIVNEGVLNSPNGQVSLHSGRRFFLERSEGTSTSIDPYIRGLVVSSQALANDGADYVVNAANAIVRADRGYVSLGASETGALLQAGIAQSSTSVARNGYIGLSGGDIRIDKGSLILANPDTGAETIPQSAASIAAFKTSRIAIGSGTSRIEMRGDSLLLAPSADVTIGASAGLAGTIGDDALATRPRVFIDQGATIDIGGMKDLSVPASRNLIRIAPVKGNELRDTPLYRAEFLNGETVLVDPRLSGVRDDGVRWIGSPLIEAASYYEQVGVSASELMTRGGNLTLGVTGFGGMTATNASDIIVKSGAQIDISGGWIRYDGGAVQTTRLISRSGQIVDIGLADPNGDYVGIVEGFSESQPRFGISATYANPVLTGGRVETAYTEGRDAGSLTLKGSVIAFDGLLNGQAFAGARQRLDARTGTATSRIYGDARALQGAASELPSAGYLNVQGTSQINSDVLSGSGDIVITRSAQITAVPSDLAFGQSFAIDAQGVLVRHDRDAGSYLSNNRRNVIALSADMLNDAGLGQLTLQTSGALTVAADVDLALADGGIFNAISGRAITIDGAVSAASGRIDLRTLQITDGSIFADDILKPGSFDIAVNGTLSVRGRWSNDFGNAGLLDGAAFTDGGSISLRVAPRVSAAIDGNAAERLDISGSILIAQGAMVDLSGGGYVNVNGRVDTSARGGDLSLINQTNYFQLSPIPIIGLEIEGNVPGIRVSTNPDLDAAANPSHINARVSIADGAIRAHGFAGGGLFTLDTPALAFGTEAVVTGTALPLDFFARTGFASYDLTSYGTALIANRFVNDAGGYNALLATQTLSVGPGETLRLTQSRFSPIFTTPQQVSLMNLATGSDLRSVLTPEVMPDGFDRLGVDLTLGGAVELHVEAGGAIIGDATASLTISKLWNEGTIKLIGGTVTQSERLPALYAGARSARDFASFFSVNPDGSINERGANALGIRSGNRLLTNAELALTPLYLTGLLGAEEGVRLSDGSVIDLSGASLRDPRATIAGAGGLLRRTGRMVAGGTLQSLSGLIDAGDVADRPLLGEGVFASNLISLSGLRSARAFDARSGSAINLAGASDTYELINADNRYVDQPVWSAGGSLLIGGQGSLSGATIDAKGGASLAQGGTLSMVDPTLVQTLNAADMIGEISADQIMSSGFDSFIAKGALQGSGDVSLTLGRSFLLQSRPFDGDASNFGTYLPTVAASGSLSIAAPITGFDSFRQSIGSAAIGSVGTGTASFEASAFDIRGAVLFDRSIASVRLASKGDMRLIGAVPIEQRLNLKTSVANSLLGQLVVNGDLTLESARLYPTTGSSFLIASALDTGRITIGRPASAVRATTPYSAGAKLLIQAATIEQKGSIYAPLGALTLGSTTALTGGGSAFTTGATGTLAPVTQSVTVAADSITSVAADGLSIPYGTTTDQIEYYFTPTSTDPLAAPPSGVLRLAGTSVEVAAGAQVDLSGGGDVFAYEFVPGTGGSRDVLDRFNADPYSSNDGFSYPDGRQVFAIVPGISSQAIAAFDPIYSADYNDLYSGAGIGKSVYLDATPGLDAGWYTLLPAKYAILPGGMRIVEQTGIDTIAGGAAALADGTQIVTGYFGWGVTGQRESTLRTFSVQNRATFRQYSNIITTSASQVFADAATRDGLAIPRLPVDAARIVLEPVERLILEASLDTSVGTGGRGAQADISGRAFRIVSDLTAGAGSDDSIQLDADNLSALGVQSLLIGGIRTEREDGRTALAIRAGSITVENDAQHALSAPELLLATDGFASSLTLADGATLRSTGRLSDSNAADYLVDGMSAGMTGHGALLRLSSGPERLVTRLNGDAGVVTSMLDVGAASINGASVLLSSSASVAIDPSASITADNVAFDASRIGFADIDDGSGGLVLTVSLREALAGADHLTLRSRNTIGFDASAGAGSLYRFGSVTFDSAGFSAIGGNGNAAVTLRADSMRLANSIGGQASCLIDCSSGSLTIETGALSFGDGMIGTSGFGDSVSIRATSGVTYDGVGGLNVGNASLKLDTPFIVDAAVALPPGVETVLPSLSINAGGSLQLVGTPGAVLPDGTPGARMGLRAAEIAISGTHLRATAGSLTLDATGDVSLSDRAILETPSYARQFGDDADPYLVSAPGGRISLTSLGGDIVAGSSSLLNVGGERGKAGSLSLSAAKGDVALIGAIDARAPDGGGNFALDTGGTFDLGAFAAAPQGFTGLVDIRVGRGDLALASGAKLKAAGLLLAAEAGLVDIAGTIDTSGTEGGDVALYGRSGVTLRGTALIDASAKGYADKDSRQARGGDVSLGTDGDGRLSVDSGATIDVRALRPGNRLVPVERNGETLFSYVDTDLGGQLTLRAPVVTRGEGSGINARFAGTVNGARTITLEGFRRYDLATIGADGRFTGVTIADGTAILDTAQAATGLLNFLSDRGEGTIPNFIRNFDISADYGNLGTLADNAAFVARPGVELVYDGSIRLASNWNFAAADVDVDGAIATGVMRRSTLLPGKLVVNPGREADLLENHSDFLYRVGGSIHGAAGALTLRAGGDLVIGGTITDGMFTFADQSDPAYLNTVIGGASGSRQILIPFSCFGPRSCPGIANYTNSTQFLRALVNFSTISSVSTGGVTPPRPLPNDIPFNALANGAAALGAGVDGAGDPIGSASLFPILSDGRFAGSWNYNFVGGAQLATGADLLPSVDPLRVDRASSGSVSVVGERSYSYGGGQSSFADELLLVNGTFTYGLDDLVSVSGDQRRPGATGYTTVTLVAGRYSAITTLLRQKAIQFFARQPIGTYRFDGGTINPTAVNTSAALAEAFLASIEPELTAIALDPDTGLVTGGASQQPTIAYVRSLVRTGTGSIAVAAAGDVDLRNGETVTTRTLNGTGFQLGGTAVYTVGHLADTGIVRATDMATGTVRMVDPGAYLSGPVTNTETASFRYGRGTQTALAGLFVTDPVYLSGGGDIAVTAVGDVMGRRDLYNEARSVASGFSFIGSPDQPWRIGSIGDRVDLRLNPQLFTSGVGTLGGGSIGLDAGGDVSDLTIAALASATTADAIAGDGLAVTRTLLNLGSGNIAIRTNGDLLGGRIDLSRGVGYVSVAGSIRTAGLLSAVTNGDIAQNLLRVRINDAAIRFDIGGTATLQGIAALGARGNAADPVNALNSFGYYSALSAVDVTANGGIQIMDQGISVVTGRTGQAATAVYPATVNLASLTGGLTLTGGRSQSGGARTINLFPSSTGQLRLLAGGDISATTITMEDRDPGQLPGFFSAYDVIDPAVLVAGQDFNFPVILPDTSTAQRSALHNIAITHLDDSEPVRIAAGGDALDLILSLPKQARISAGRDIVNMMLFGQNLTATDITRVVAGRDIVATSTLTRAQLDGGLFGDPLPALQGNSFIMGGPGTFFLEAGRDAGPFLNSAIVDPRRVQNDVIDFYGSIAMGGGILSVGNEWNPALPDAGADINVMFGVAKGVDYAALRDTYLNPARIDQLDDDLFDQVKDVNGNLIADRTKPIYSPILIAWMKANAADVLTEQFGTTNVDVDQAYAGFLKLPELRQRSFLLKDVYFNELELTSRPDGPSYLQYSRGYKAVNTLFSPDLGYTRNNLEGGEAGASQTVLTGNLDLRLATIQTSRGGNIALLGPGGRILAGSTVRTSEQAARRSYDGTRLFAGDRAVSVASNGNPALGFSQISPASISAIPTGYEGIITLRGGRVMSFTDGSLLLNQSRLFTQGGGDITLWSSNGDLNAGQGPKSSASFPPVVVRIDDNGFSQVDAVGGVSGAGIAAFSPGVGVQAPDVYLIAPRGTVDAGDAGVRVAGNLFVAAAAVANADNFQVGGTSIGVVSSPVVDAGAVAASNAASAAATEAAKGATANQDNQPRTQIYVDVQGYAGGKGDDERCKRDPRPSDCPAQ